MPTRKPDSQPEHDAPLTDRALLPDASLADLDPARVAHFLRVRESAAPFEEADALTPEPDADDAPGDDVTDADETALDEATVTALLDVGLVRKSGSTTRPTVAALLVIGRVPQRLLPHTSLKLARFRGDDETGLIVDRAELAGRVDTVIEEAARFVARNMRISASIRNDSGVYRQETPEYPLAAVREAIINGVAHRDYGLTGQKIVLRMFDDRLEVESPGGLVGPVTLETLGQKRYSRNPLLARSMYELRLIEELGTGIKRMRRLMTELGSPPPRFAADATTFMVTLPALPLEDDRAVGENRTVATPTPDTAPLLAISAANRDEYMKLLGQGVNERQARGLLFARERGRLTNRDYRAVNPDISDETARLDLGDLVARGLMLRLGDRRGAAYLPR